MNTTEIKYDKIIKNWEDLLKLAKKQFLNYEKIEGIKDWNKYDFSIDCSEDQMKFKDMLQIRFVEELTEASVAMDDEDHFMEEITDSFNFFISSYFMLGFSFNDFKNPDEILLKEFKIIKLNKNLLSMYFYPVIEKVGKLCNLLKNRPWTQSNYLVSMTDFNICLKELWEEYFEMLSKLGLSTDKLFELFEKKYKVNLWRIKTGY